MTEIDRALAATEALTRYYAASDCAILAMESKNSFGMQLALDYLKKAQDFYQKYLNLMSSGNLGEGNKSG